jgi:hypothetical protein
MISFENTYNILKDSPAHCALLDFNGNILDVNDAWKSFADSNCGNVDTYEIGSNYIDACRAAGEDFYAKQAIEKFFLVKSKTSQVHGFVYPCDSPDVERWFVCRFYNIKVAILVMHFLDYRRLKARDKPDPTKSFCS